MILISTTHHPATDLGYLLHKNPARIHESNLTFGKATVFYPEASEERTTAALVAHVDPVKLVRGSGGLDQYVNDRPYVANSYLSVALVDLFKTTISGRCKEKPELAETPIPLEIRIPVLPCRAGEARLRSLFEPLGYTVEITPIPLDDQFPEWGPSSVFDVTLKGTKLLRDALRQIYILIPVLDTKKHYYMELGEVEKILSKGKGWLADHPERNWILRASLGSKPSLLREAMAQLAQVESSLINEAERAEDSLGTKDEKKPTLHSERHKRVVELVKALQPRSVLDLGCGDGKLMRQLIKIQGIEKIVGMDVSYYDLERAKRALYLEDATPAYRERIQLIHGSLMYSDERLRGFDVCAVVEVIEHLDEYRLEVFESVLFSVAQPRTVILTTPNREYNAQYGLEGFRHSDHRFEWTRAEFRTWCERVAAAHGYSVEIEEIGDEVPEWGKPSQLALFHRLPGGGL